MGQSELCSPIQKLARILICTLREIFTMIDIYFLLMDCWKKRCSVQISSSIETKRHFTYSSKLFLDFAMRGLFHGSKVESDFR